MDDIFTAYRTDLARSDSGTANILLEQAIQLATEPGQLVDLGIACRDTQKPALAFRTFSHINERWPGYVPAYYEAAFAHRLQGEHLDAARLLLRAAVHAPADKRLIQFLIHMLHAIGAHDEADRHWRTIEPLIRPEEQEEFQALAEFGRYLRAWPRGAALLLLDRVQARYPAISADEVAARILEAVRTRSPFALVRLGDGEGGSISLGLEDEAAYPNLYRRNRRELNAMWFGDFPIDTTDFIHTSREILPESLKADVVGLPYEGWVSHEYTIASLRGVPSLLNVLRAYERVGPTRTHPPASCSQLVHMELHRKGHLETIVRAAGAVSVISCLPELPGILRQHFGFDDIVLYRIPGEKGSASALGSEAVMGEHYPGVYQQLQASLRVPHEGRLFLVAGGILGKFYATTIRQFGGIAIDVGSVADGWASKHTRPGMGPETALTLQQA